MKEHSPHSKPDPFASPPAAGSQCPPQRDLHGPAVLERVERLKQDLLAKVRALGRELPVNTLDQLIDQLGGPEYVAEVSVGPGWLQVALAAPAGHLCHCWPPEWQALLAELWRLDSAWPAQARPHPHKSPRSPAAGLSSCPLVQPLCLAQLPGSHNDS